MFVGVTEGDSYQLSKKWQCQSFPLKNLDSELQASRQQGKGRRTAVFIQTNYTAKLKQENQRSTQQYHSVETYSLWRMEIDLNVNTGKGRLFFFSAVLAVNKM